MFMPRLSAVLTCWAGLLSETPVSSRRRSQRMKGEELYDVLSQASTKESLTRVTFRQEHSAA